MREILVVYFFAVLWTKPQASCFFSRRFCEHLTGTFFRHDGKRISTPPRNNKRKLPKSIRERSAKGTVQNRGPVQPYIKELY